MEYTLENYWTEVQEYQRRHPKCRAGQAAFNVLDLRRPGVSARIRMTVNDPFNAKHIPEGFRGEVARLWGDNPRPSRE